MRFSVLILGLVILVPHVAFADEMVLPDFGWTLSASNTDPFDNVGPAMSDTLTLYLWFYCSTPITGGVSRSEFGFVFNPNLDVYSFEPANGVVDSAASVWDFDLTLPDCPRGSLLAGQVRLQNLAGSFVVCLGPGSEGNLSYGCTYPTNPGENAFLGYAAGLKLPCANGFDFFDGNCFPEVSVAPYSWGRIKALYTGTSSP